MRLLDKHLLLTRLISLGINAIHRIEPRCALFKNNHFGKVPFCLTRIVLLDGCVRARVSVGRSIIRPVALSISNRHWQPAHNIHWESLIGDSLSLFRCLIFFFKSFLCVISNWTIISIFIALNDFECGYLFRTMPVNEATGRENATVCGRVHPSFRQNIATSIIPIESIGFSLPIPCKMEHSHWMQIASVTALIPSVLNTHTWRQLNWRAKPNENVEAKKKTTTEKETEEEGKKTKLPTKFNCFGNVRISHQH